MSLEHGGLRARYVPAPCQSKNHVSALGHHGVTLVMVAVRPKPIVIEPENETHAALFSEVCFGLSSAGDVAVSKEGIITLKVRRMDSGRELPPRMFYASWDVAPRT